MAEEIIKQIDEIYPKVKALVNLAGMDREGWVIASLMEAEKGDHKHFIRCENCVFNECEAIKNLKEKYALIVKLWATHGCSSCQKFSPKPDADGVI